jgi:hypothetical protein
MLLAAAKRWYARPVPGLVLLTLAVGAGALALAGPAATAPADITRPLLFRPLAADQTVLQLADLFIHDITDSKGINITPTALPDGRFWTYRQISIRRCTLARINRSPAGAAQCLHTDFVRICGAGDAAVPPAEVLIEDLTLRDGNSLPLLIQDGRFSRVTLRRLSIINTTRSAQIAAINTGRFDLVIVEDCPGLRLALMGRPGSIGKCMVRNSPGASITDTLTQFGRSGAVIEHQPTTAPTTTTALPAKTPATSTRATSDDRELTIQGRRYRLVDAD